MSNPEHNYDALYDVDEGDEVTLVTHADDEFDVTCTDRSTRHSDDPDDVSEYRTWTFDHDGRTLKAQVTEGLKSYEWEAPYPRSLPLYDPDEDDVKQYGYIVEIR